MSALVAVRRAEMTTVSILADNASFAEIVTGLGNWQAGSSRAFDALMGEY